MKPLSPALGTLVALTSPWLDADGDPASLVHPQADWADILAHARRHRIVAFLAHRIERTGLHPTVPAPVASELRKEAQLATFHEMAMLALVRNLKERFDAADLRFALIKGLVLSSRCYGSLGLRTNRDIDLLVAPEDLGLADEILRKAGFWRIEPEGDPTPEQLADWVRRSKDWVYFREQGGAVVELHHRLFDNRTLADGELLDRAEPVTLFGDLEVLTLNRQDEIPYLALHGALHAWSRLKWLLDLGFILKELDPDSLAMLVSLANRGPATRAIRQAVNLCDDLFAASLMQSANRGVTDNLLSAAARKALCEGGTEELENSRFGTTLKNASHYLLWQNPRYLAAEVAFDMTDTSRDGQLGEAGVPRWFSRPINWIARHLRRPTSG